MDNTARSGHFVSLPYAVFAAPWLSVDDRGYTVKDATARPFDVALDWTDLDAYRDLLTERMTAAVVPGRWNAADP